MAKLTEIFLRHLRRFVPTKFFLSIQINTQSRWFVFAMDRAKFDLSGHALWTGQRAMDLLWYRSPKNFG